MHLSAHPTAVDGLSLATRLTSRITNRITTRIVMTMATAGVLLIPVAAISTQAVPGYPAPVGITGLTPAGHAANDGAEAGYPTLQLNNEGHEISRWYFEPGTRDNLWHNVYR